MIRLRENSTPRHLPTGFRAASEPGKAWSDPSDVRPAARLVGIHERGEEILARTRDCSSADRRSTGYRRAVLDGCPLYLHSVLNSRCAGGLSGLPHRGGREAVRVHCLATPEGSFDSGASRFTIRWERSTLS